MINFRIIARVFSLVLIIEGLFMLLSAGVSYLFTGIRCNFTCYIQRLLQLSQVFWSLLLCVMKKRFTEIRKDILLLQAYG